MYKQIFTVFTVSTLLYAYLFYADTEPLWNWTHFHNENIWFYRNIFAFLTAISSLSWRFLKPASDINVPPQHLKLFDREDNDVGIDALSTTGMGVMVINRAEMYM